ncbi:hypothetical protein LJC49_04090 [Ruminococcaceae bacterium OttesenSCG-928-I18]|nr:hypothetical protein [Ruminococcaceae bacterium OttesenSCG-928-I18]
MPSYRYLKDIKPEDIKPPEPPKEPSPKEKMANWWHYHWYYVVGALAVVGVVLYFVIDGQRAEEPDLRVGLTTEHELPPAFVESLQLQLAQGLPDMNADGRAEVGVEVYVVQLDEGDAMAEAAQEFESSEGEQSEAQELANPYAQIAGVTHLTAALKNGDPAFMILSPAHEAAFVGQELRSRGAEVVPVEALPGFASMDLGYETPEGRQDGHELIQGYFAAVIPADESGAGAADRRENWMRAQTLLELLKEGGN